MPKHVLFIFGGAIGDALLGIQLFHAMQKSDPSSTLTFVATGKSGFSRQVASSIAGISYVELPPRSWRSWARLLSWAFSPHGVVYLEPFRDGVSFWWRVIARVATVLPGSREVHCQSRPAKVPERVRVVAYRCQADNLFDMVTRVPAALGGTKVEPFRPYLPTPNCSATSKPYIAFHFFAGSYRRSFPLEKVRPLLAAAREAFPQDEFVLTCAHGEETLAAQMIEGVSNARVVISPKAQELYCHLVGARVVVGVASGVTHIAAHLNARAVVLCNLSDPCWLPTYNPSISLLSAPEHCGCNGDKTGECGIETPGGSIYRCLYDITQEDIIGAMQHQVDL